MGGIRIDANFVAFLVVPLWLVFRLVRIYLLKKKGELKYCREVLVNLFFVYILMVIIMVLFPVEIIFDRSEILYNNRVNFIPVVKAFDLFNGGQGISWDVAFKNIFGNLMLLFPLGVVLPALFKKFNRLSVIAFIGFIVSLSIETLQYLESFISESYRISDIDDVILNTIGVVLGYMFFMGLIKKRNFFVTASKSNQNDI